MKRRVLTTLVFLLLGAIVNVAVAWACAMLLIRPGVDLGRETVWVPNPAGGFDHGSVGIIKSAGLPCRTFEGFALSPPTDPLWPGFAINTLFYAGILWLLFAAPFALRRRRRIRRGLCPACAYDLRGSAPHGGSQTCPECGAIR